MRVNRTARAAILLGVALAAMALVSMVAIQMNGLR
jgi:NO-binding membrane sensor protein with MHYT domain